MYEKVHWLYLNLADGDANSFIPAWAAYRGILATPNVLLSPEQRKTHLGLTPHLVRLLRKKDAIALRKELALERIRRARYKSANSRLNCFYCWPDQATARLASKFWDNQGPHFRERYLTEVGVSASKAPTIVDTRWIDHFVINSTQPIEAIGLDWIDQYWSGSLYPWSGEHDIPSEPLMECLVDGTALVYGVELRMDAFNLVQRLQSETVGFLESGRLAVDLCVRFNGTNEWRLGQIVPVLIKKQESKSLVVNNFLFWDMPLIKSVERIMLSAPIRHCEINRRALAVFERPSLKVPNLGPPISLDWLDQQFLLLEEVHALFTSFFVEHGGSLGTQPAILGNATSVARMPRRVD